MTRRIVTAREQFAMLAPWLREATPWRSKPGDPTYAVPTEDLLQHRQFNPAIQTPEEMHHSLWTHSYDPDKEPYRNNFTNSWSSGGGSEGSNEEDIVEGIEKGHKLPPVEIVTNGAAATLSDGNHRTEVADMMGKDKLESYIHYAPHNPDSFFQHPVDPHSELGKHIDNLVQNHPYEPVEGGPTTDHVFRKHPETGRWERGKITDSSPHFVDTPEYHEQMKQKVPHFKPSGLGTYFDVDWGNGPEITHERHLYARRLGIQQPHPDLKLHYHPTQESVDAAYGPGEINAPAVTAHHPDSQYQPTGWLQWDTADNPERPNTVSWIDVDPDYRRQGIGAEMWNHALQHNPDLKHSEQRSIEGDDWAHAVGGHLPPLMDEDDEDWL